MQKTDLLTDPSNLKNKLTPEFADREAELRATSSPKNKKTSPRASKPNPRTKRGREGFTMEQTKEDNALLKRYGTDKAFRSVLGGKWGFDTTSALSSVGHYVTRTLGLKGVVFVDDAGISSLLRTGAVKGRLAEALAAARDNPSVKAQNIRMHDNSFVYFSDQILGDQALSVLAAGHELGHQLYRVAWDKLSDSGKERLYSAYLKDKGVKVVDQADFNEWMADQLAAWITRPTLRGSEALQGATGRFFFQRVAENVRKLWNYIKNNKRWQLNETFNEFANAVALKAKTTNDPASNPYNAAVLREWFADGGVTMYEWFGKTLETDNMSFEPVTEAGKQALKRVETRYPKLAERAIPLRNWMVNAYNVALAPSTSVMRTMAAEGIWAADTLADMFHRKALGAAKGPTAVFIQDKQKMQGQFVTKMDEIVNVVEEEILAKNPGISNKRLAKKREAAIRRLGESLHKKDSDLNATFSETEQKVRNLMDDLHQYAVRSGLPVSYVPNYFPRAYDKDLLIRDEKKIIAYLQRQGVKNGQSPAVALAQAGKTYNSLVSDPNAMDGRASSDPRDIDLDTQTPGFAAMNSRTSKSTFWDQYLDNNVEAVVARYITQVVKRAEFNKRLGQPYPQELGTSSDSVATAVREGSWDPKGKLHEILKEAANQGATPEQLTNMKKYIDANMGQLGRDLNPTVRKWMAGVVAYQNMRVLLFTVFASLPDMVGPAIRSGDMRLTWNALKSNIAEIAKKEGALQTQAETLGLIQSVANEHVMTEYVDNHYMPPRLRKWNQEFFKWTGLNYYTDFTRKYALAVGKSYLEKNMDLAQHGKTAQDRARGKDMLAELGVTPAQVQEWLDAGKPTYDSWSDPPQGTNEKVAEALIQFVDESIMRPNASQRPLLASDPRAMLVYHLKNFMYAIHDIILKRLKFNIDESKSPAQYMAALAPALMMMMLTAVGLELRELIQYAGSNRTPPTDRMDGWDYTWELAQRSGLTGTAQIAIDFEGADDRGMSHVAGLLGPAVGQVANVISRPSTQTVPKAIPVVSQIPARRLGRTAHQGRQRCPRGYRKKVGPDRA
jgi:hypothetical protein